MTTIAELAHKDGRAGSNGSWRSETIGSSRVITHYSTRMLEFGIDNYGWDGNLDTVYMTIGHGSVSDQGGMNALFQALGMPLRFSRRGGARILPTDPDVITGCYQSGNLYTMT